MLYGHRPVAHLSTVAKHACSLLTGWHGASTQGPLEAAGMLVHSTKGTWEAVTEAG